MPTERDPASDLIVVFLNLAALNIDFLDATTVIALIDQRAHRLGYTNVWPAVGSAVIGEYAPIREYGVDMSASDDDPLASQSQKALARLRRIADQLETL